MTGIGRSHGAVSVLNAIPCGIGSAMGLDLWTRAVFEPSDRIRVELAGREGMDTLMAETCVKRALERIGEDPGMGFDLVVESEIPPSKGLKSSSSVCNAVISSVLDHFGMEMDAVEMMRLGVECARECGVTITGAFDDACGCHLGGLVVTDNFRCEILYRKAMPVYDAVIVIPDGTIRKKDVDAESYRRMGCAFRSLSARIADDPLSVLTENGRMVARIAGIDDAAAEKALSLGALAAGVTGTGPAVAIVIEKGRGRKMAEEFGEDVILSRII